MFEKLQKKWKVSGIQLILIICTFALGGSACGYVARKVMELISLDKGVLWWVLYLLMVTILWPVCVLIISILFGQFKFFRNYLNRIAVKMKLKRKQN